MTTNRVPLHRGLNSAGAAWGALFATGFDLAGRLGPFGLNDDDRDPEARAVFEAAARSAWAEFGEAFMAAWRPTDVRTAPWAQEQFGEPWTGR